MKSWFCLFLVTLATATQAAPRKDLPPKKASHSIVAQHGATGSKAGGKPGQAAPAKVSTAKGGKVQQARQAPAQPPQRHATVKKAAGASAAAAAATAALVLAKAPNEPSPSLAPPTEALLAQDRALAALPATGTPAEPGTPRSTWQGIRHSVSEKALFMADKAHGVVDGAAHVVVDRTAELVVHAMGFLGVPYRRGGNNVETGFDCSGFVRAMFQQTVGALLPRSAREQADATEVIDRQELRPGDLVFFNTMRRAFSHVGIYVGDGKFIHSPRSGSVVRVEDMKESYWANRFNGARRVSGVEAAEVQAAIAAKRY